MAHFFSFITISTEAYLLNHVNVMPHSSAINRRLQVVHVVEDFCLNQELPLQCLDERVDHQDKQERGECISLGDAFCESDFSSSFFAPFERIFSIEQSSQ